MKIIFIPPNDGIYEDKQCKLWMNMSRMSELLAQLLDEPCSCELFNDMKQLMLADWVVFCNIRLETLQLYTKICRAGLARKTIYWMMEPESVMPWHTQQGIVGLKKYFRYIITWNRELVDSERVFDVNFLYNHQFFEDDIDVKHVAWSEKKLLVNISGNKSSKSNHELYSERLKVIQYYEKNHSDDFSLYGSGWERIEPKLSTYGGRCDSKKQVYSMHKFALCLENVSGLSGYVTEKIVDCFESEIVPIYMGAKNIDEIVPRDCYIDYEQFQSIEDLHQYLFNVSEEKYQEYLLNIHRYLDNQNCENDYWGVARFANKLSKVLTQTGEEMIFKVNYWDALMIQVRYWRGALKKKLYDVALVGYHWIKNAYSQ